MARSHHVQIMPIAGALLVSMACSSTDNDANMPGDGDPSAATGGLASPGTGGQTLGSGGSISGSGGSETANSGGANTSSGGAEPTGTGGSTQGTPSACDPSVSEANRNLVAQAIDELFIDQDLTAIDRHWSDPYLQHNPIAMSGIATFKSVMGSFVTSPSFEFTRLRTLADCDLVVVQGRYSGTGVIFDMFRVTDGKIMEHWDSDANQASAAEGPMMLSDLDKTAENRAIFEQFFVEQLTTGGGTQGSSFVAESFTSHRVAGESGPAAWLAYLNDESIVYTELHHQIVDGNFVITLSEGLRNGTPYGFYDLFRLEDGMIVEHWDSRRAVPNSTASGLEIF